MTKTVDRRTPRVAYPDTLEVEGNNGGSYIRLTKTNREGIVHLEVGETCVRTISQEISVCALAVILTWARDYGFQKILDEVNRGVLFFETDRDPIAAKGAGDDR